MKNKHVDGIKASTVILLVASACLFIFTIYTWYNNLYMRDTNVVWGAFNNALDTKGVTKEISLSAQDVTQKQTIIYSFSPELETFGEVRTEGPGEKVTVNQTISTPKKDFSRYSELVQPDPVALNDIINIWAQTTPDTATESTLMGQQFASGPLVLVGNFSHDYRSALLQKMKSSGAYEVMGRAGTKKFGDKTAIIYKVKLDVDAYNLVLTDYLTKLGLDESAQAVSNAGGDTSFPIIEIAVEPRTRTVMAAGYPTLDASGAEKYSLWGVGKDIEAPESFLSFDELQTKLQSIYN